MAVHRSGMSADKVRQGETGHGVRFVLGYGLVLAIAAMALVLAFTR